MNRNQIERCGSHSNRLTRCSKYRGSGDDPKAVGRPATGQGKTIYVPDRFLNIVEMLKSEDWEGAVKEILDLCPFND